MTPITVTAPWFGPEEEQAVIDVLRSGWVTQGPRVAQFERAFADRVGAVHAVATSSCTTGLHLALVAAGIGPGDEVIVPSLSFIASTTCVRYVGARPVFADVDPATLCVTAETVERRVTDATRGVLVVHQAGAPADMTSIREVCDRRGLTMVEDAACALGSTIAGRPVGAGADIAVFSLHPRKVITTGEGGMVVTGSSEWDERLRRLRDHGSTRSAADRHAAIGPSPERYEEPGFNHRMTDIQAAIGIVQLGRLDAILAARRRLARRYQDAFEPIAGVRTASDPPYGQSNYQSFWLTLDDELPVDRDVVLGALAADGISARPGIMASHLEPACADLDGTDLPVTEHLAARSLILPLAPQLTDDEQDRVIAAVTAATARVGAPC